MLIVVENNYLSQKQQAQTQEELAEYQSVACKAQTQAKRTAIDLGQDSSFAAGMAAGVPAGLYDAVKQSYIDRIDQMEAEYQKAGASGSFNAGLKAVSWSPI
ncbi:filamentous hemagglutinin [Rosenbergiella nectarea]|uniref:Filamentous hemagglutinin n=1 Tax=Rosenbergiella nectarea TaxID=988801 RepID=A0A1H9LP22_9GAMM|nr:hypothetical protein [Rosenbergiella nectarea]SER13130.1 filamentous hemagglutinin [Rosenbergiella nectarea]